MRCACPKGGSGAGQSSWADAARRRSLVLVLAWLGLPPLPFSPTAINTLQPGTMPFNHPSRRFMLTPEARAAAGSRMLSWLPARLRHKGRVLRCGQGRGGGLVGGAPYGCRGGGEGCSVSRPGSHATAGRCATCLDNRCCRNGGLRPPPLPASCARTLNPTRLPCPRSPPPSLAAPS